MKRNVLLLSMLILWAFTQAQVVYNRPDYIHVNDEIPVAIYSNTDPNTGMPLTSFGPEDELVFGVFTYEQCILDTVRFVAPSVYDPAGDFSGATVAFINDMGFTVFMKISWTEANIIGMAGEMPMMGVPAVMKATDSLAVMHFPIAAPYSLNEEGTVAQKFHISEFQEIIPPDYYQPIASLYDTIQVALSMYQMSEFDLNTSITIADTNSYNATREVLRELREERTVTNIFIRSKFTGEYFPLQEAPFIGDMLPVELPMLDSTYSIHYWAYSLSIPLVSIQVSPDRQTAYNVKYYNGEFLGNKNTTMPVSWNVYPNPVTDIIYFKNASAHDAQIKIYSIDGKVVHNMDISSDIYIFDTRNLRDGLYLYEIVSQDSGARESGKFQVVR